MCLINDKRATLTFRNIPRSKNKILKEIKYALI